MRAVDVVADEAERLPDLLGLLRLYPRMYV
jgi:hypothetical protein